VSFAESIGLPVRVIEIALASITVLAVAVGIQAVGVVLMAAMLITPAAAARYWTDKLPKMVFLAAVFGAVSGIFGAFISYQGSSMPTGPWIVVVLSSVAIFSMLVAPKRGVLSRYLAVRSNNLKILEENVLKIFYHLGERENAFFEARKIEELKAKRDMPSRRLKEGIQRLVAKDLLQKSGVVGKWLLTEKGKSSGQRVVRLHRLWELYLSRYLHLAADHVHHDAEAIEHIITPEIEAQLERELDFPEKDPHDSVIPEAI
ncbi:MAG: metal ABC transporter permease, partial [Chitinophagales bacterium]